MLKTIPSLLTPDLLYSLALMGHGDRLAIVDANYPATAHHSRVHTLFGTTTTEALDAILTLFPVDDFVEPAALRMVPDGDPEARFDSHDAVARALSAAEQRPVDVHPVERTRFYRSAADAFAVVHTTDARPFSCFLITKGVVR